MINKKRALKRRQLIRKLFKYYLLKTKLDKIKLQIIDKDENTTYCNSYYPNQRKIKIDLPCIKNNRIKGYGDDYYRGRDNRLSFVKGNIKLCLRFVILHELGHSYLRDINENTEYNADSYAIENLTKEGLIK